MIPYALDVRHRAIGQRTFDIGPTQRGRSGARFFDTRLTGMNSLESFLVVFHVSRVPSPSPVLCVTVLHVRESVLLSVPNLR
jgi:hypothetical protein